MVVLYRTILFTSLFFVTACASWNATVLRNNNLPLVTLQRTVASVLPQGVREVSSNAREFYSNYFVPHKKKYEDGRKSPVRYTAHVSILGDRRPYTIEILVSRERQKKARGPGGERIYTLDGSDEKMGKRLARRLSRKINKPKDDRNVVDDFRVF